MSERHVHRRESKRVVVVGAGIAGLTAAHELVERGFEVEVVERDMELAPVERPYRQSGAKSGGGGPPGLEADREELGWQPRIGGMARTQWGVGPPPPERTQRRIEMPADQAPRLQRLPSTGVPRPVVLWVIPGKNGNGTKAGFAQRGSDDLHLQLVISPEEVIGALRPLLELFRDWSWSFLTVDAECLEGHESSLAAAIKEVKTRLTLTDHQKARLQLHWPPQSHRDAPRRWPGGVLARVYVSLEHDRYPAEHGFRFFPSFYLHLFDTMERTPLPAMTRLTRQDRRETGERVWDEDSGRSAFDNLVSAEKFRFAPETAKHGGAPFAAHRRPPRSVMEAREYLRGLLESIGYDTKSVARLNAKLVQYLTSCEQRRRAEYETISWQEFVDPESRLDPRLAEHLVAAPQALAAMNAERNDARTIAYVGLQMLLDHFRFTNYSDGTLNGPTSEAWLEPWRDYLASQGVKFTAGQLVGFQRLGPPGGAMSVVRPVVLAACGVKTTVTDGQTSVTPLDWEPIDHADYTVITTPVDKLYSLLHPPDEPSSDVERDIRAKLKKIGIDLLRAKELLSLNDRWLAQRVWRESPSMTFEDAPQAAVERNDLRRCIEFIDERASLQRTNDRPDEGPLRWMVGIQFFFESEVQFIKGHTFCSDSPWGVSYLSQAQYWTQKPRTYDGYRGVLSAIFTRFETDGVVYGRPAKYCSPDQIAEEVWAQIVAAMEPGEKLLKEPLYYYIDENLEWDSQGVWVVNNRTPYLVNHVDDWDRRPGRRSEAGDYRYDLQVGNCVLAGVFMRTHTRLTTMESANESARHAVNAILDNEGSPLQRCRIFRLEDEMAFEDLAPLRELDEKLFTRGTRHLLDNWLTESTLRALPFDLTRFLLPFRDRRPT